MMKTSFVGMVCSWFAGLLMAFSLAGPVWGEDAKATGAGKTSAAVPAHRVIACYFDVPNCCPTCTKMGQYIEEAVHTGFAAETKDGRVSSTMIDLRDPKNKKLLDAYKITGTTLVIMDVRDGKVVAWKSEPKVWKLVTNKEAFVKFVQEEIRGYSEAE